jgi:GDP/UDP-N,N'-diacetylbacillosamine 2-epimerase (hydrolysing)
MHLSEEFGLTYREIEESGFVIDRKIGGLIKNDSPITTSGYMGNTLVDCTRAISDLKPDLVLVLGDRFEIFAAATSALISKVPIAHIHGGEVTIGAFRHSITKMSHIHFTATEEYRRRVIQLGENPRNVHMVGAVGIDDIRNIKLSTRKSIEQEIGIKFKKRNLLVTFHPATLEDEPVERQMSELLKSLQSFYISKCRHRWFKSHKFN